jgi:dihydroorotase
LQLETALRALTAGPVRSFGLERRAPGIGTLERGVASDLVLFDPTRRWTVEAARMISKGKNTPLLGRELVGEVVAVVIGGSLVFEREQAHV